MKKIFFLVLVTLICQASVRAQSCQSIFSGAEPIFNNMAKEYIKFRMDAAKVFVPVVLPGLSGAQQEVNKLIDEATQMQLQLYTSYGVMAGEGNMSVGAVNLIVPLKKWTGDLYTERTFQILSSPYDKIVITIKKTGGRRGMKFRACAKYSNGSRYDEGERVIDKDATGNAAVRTITFPRGMVDKNISLHLVAHGALPTDKCEYTLSVEGFFDNGEMQKIYDDNHMGDANKSWNPNNNQANPGKPRPDHDQSGQYQNPKGTGAIKSPRDISTGQKQNQGNAQKTKTAPGANEVNKTKLDDLKNPFDTTKKVAPVKRAPAKPAQSALRTTGQKPATDTTANTPARRPRRELQN